MRRTAPGLLLAALVGAVPASAQDIPGVGSGSMDLSGMDPAGSSAPAAGFSQSSGAAAPRVTSSPLGSPDQMFGLQEGDTRPVITLDEAITRSAEHSWDLRIAREKVVQQEAAVRRAWSALLPQVQLGGSYTLNCTTTPDAPLFSEDERVRTFTDCRDVGYSFTNDEAVTSQVQLLTALGTIIQQAAELETDPARKEEYQQQADGLLGSAQRAEQGRAEATKPIVVQPANVFGGSLSVSIPLFNGRAFPLLQNAYSAVDVVDIAGDQARDGLKLAVTRAYYSAFTAQKLVHIAKEQQASAEQHRDAVRVRVELQTQPPLALRRAELDVIRAQQSVRQAEAGYRAAVAGVGSLAGIDSYFDVVEPPAIVPVENEGSEQELIERAISSRPDLRAQKLAVTIADRNKLDAWMMFLPSVNLVGQSRITSNTGGFVNAPISSALMVQATVPLYDGGARYAALRDSSSRVREELMKVRQLEERVIGQVRGNLEELKNRTLALQLAREAVAVSKETADQARELYDAGAATSLDVSDSRLAVFVAELELARAELDVEQARLGVAYIVGALPGPSPEARVLDAEEEAAARALVEGSDP